AILQYRRKKVAKEDQIYEIAYMKAMCAEYAVPIVTTDELELAAKYVEGGHLGQEAGSIVDAHARSPASGLIGRRGNNLLELAEQAIADGANYVAFGAIYATDSKPEAGNIGLETLKLAKEKLNVPLCAIGGLTVENSKDVIESGADYCAVISDILGLPMNAIPERLDEWSALFQATA